MTKPTPIDTDIHIKNATGEMGYPGKNRDNRTVLGVDTIDDVIVSDSKSGFVLKDTQAIPHYWRIKVDNTGKLSTVDLGTVKP